MLGSSLTCAGESGNRDLLPLVHGSQDTLECNASSRVRPCTGYDYDDPEMLPYTDGELMACEFAGDGAL